MRVLVIEDDSNITRSIELMLKTDGHVCDCAAKGEEGISLGSRNPYDIIIVDLMLPDMEGYEVVRQLRAGMVTTPILILSGLAELDSKVKGLGAGADDYLTKPFDRDELIARVQALVRRSMGYSTVPDGETAPGSLLAQKGAASPWSFNMSYTPYGQNGDEAAEGEIPPVAEAAPPQRPRLVIKFPDGTDPADYDEGEEEIEEDFDDYPATARMATLAPGMSGPRTGRIIVLGNEKIGTGKSTTAMHLIVALLREGHSVASVDLDTEQGTLTRYIENRRAFGKDHGLDLVCPSQHAGDLDDAASETLEEILETYVADHDFVVVDTPGSESHLSNVAHEWADTLIAPINDDPVDLGILARVEEGTLEFVGPSHYSDMVAEARKLKAERSGDPIDWIVLRNRLTSLHKRNRKDLSETLQHLSDRMGFREEPGLREREIFAELFESGLTLLDLRDRGVDIEFTMSHVAARQEFRTILQAVQSPAPDDIVVSPKSHADDSEDDAMPHDEPPTPDSEPLVAEASGADEPALSEPAPQLT